MSDDSLVFEKYGCVKVNKFIDEQAVGIVSQYLENKIRRGEWVEGVEEGMHVTRYSYYADPLIEALLLSYQTVVENTIEKQLIPTYSYARIYQPGESLRPHVDRPSCEISVTVNVATKGNFSPIYMQYMDNEPVKYTLEPGDAVIYKGCEATHWRPVLQAEQLNVQFMLHYVDKNGIHADHAKDKRPAYGFSTKIRSC